MLLWKITMSHCVAWCCVTNKHEQLSPKKTSKFFLHNVVTTYFLGARYWYPHPRRWLLIDQREPGETLIPVPVYRQSRRCGSLALPWCSKKNPDQNVSPESIQMRKENSDMDQNHPLNKNESASVVKHTLVCCVDCICKLTPQKLSLWCTFRIGIVHHQTLPVHSWHHGEC